MGKLTVRTGPQAGTEFPVDRPSIRIGRGSGNDIVLQDSQSSRQHAEISRQGDQFYVRDIGSTNGTFVNGERVTGLRLLHPGDQIRIGDTTIGYQPGAVATAPPLASDWESELYSASGPAAAGRSRSPWLIAGLAALIVVLLVGAAAAAVFLLRGDKATPTAGVVAATETATSAAVVVAPSATPESGVSAQPTVTPLVDIPTVEVPTVAVPTLAAQVSPPAAATLPAVPPGMPSSAQSIPSSPQDLEQLPAEVMQFLGNVPPEQLPQVIAQQMQSIPMDQLQQMVGALFPGVRADQLPQVVAASFPGLSEQDVKNLLNQAFPGQNITIPEGSVGGRVVLGIYDRNKNQYDVHIANIPGGPPRLLIENASDPSFSPNSQLIVYHSSDPAKSGLRICKADGSEDRALTSVASDRNPRFSPDGTRILYSNIDNNTLHVINLDGTGRRDVGQGKYPDWSPDGREIVFQGCVGGGRCGLIRANANGSNAQQITTHANDTMPRWKYGNVAFLSDRDGNFEVYAISDNGTWLRRITLVPATDIMPVWNPGGVQLAFRSDRGGDPALYVTSGIGGGDFKQFSAAFGPDWMLAGMDWGR